MNEADVSKWAKRHNLDRFPSELRAMINDAFDLFGTSEPVAQRQWVGLTGDEREQIYQEHYPDSVATAIAAVENKLKEKNHD